MFSFRFQKYMSEIFRACRLIVDTGIHAFGWVVFSCIFKISFDLINIKNPFFRWTCTTSNWCKKFCSIFFFRWTKERAIEFMKNYTNAPTGEVAREIDRYITWPGQACAYKVGELKIRELRQRAETVLGKDLWTHHSNDTTALIINTRRFNFFKGSHSILQILCVRFLRKTTRRVW